MKIVIDGQEVSIPGGSGGGGVPKGTIVIWSGGAEDIPEGWALCDGQDGRPDLRDRFVLGGGGTHTVSSTGGEETHTLTEAEMPEHDHTVKYSVQTGSGYNSVKDSGGIVGGTIATGSTGGSQPHNNMPPYYVLCYIIKVSEDNGGSGGASAGEVYSTEETRIGTWIDGKPLYRKVYHAESELKANVSSFVPIDPDFHETLISAKGFAQPTWSSRYALPYTEMSGSKIVHSYSIGQSFETGDYTLWANCFSSYDTGLELYVICEYTKTTD